MNKISSWQPSAPISNLLQRAKILAKIRHFFTNHDILEVETPSMSQATVTDVHLESFQTCFISPDTSHSLDLWLITSPEYHMKRLLAANSGPIYQISRSFRNKEVGRYHNPEFTILEWYRPCYDMYSLMNEVDDLLQQVLKCSPAELFSYQQVFNHYLAVDPLSADITQLRDVAKKLGVDNLANIEEDRDTLLQLLFLTGIEPKIGLKKPIFIYHFPATQAALAEINIEDHRVSERFEVYFKGIELANGFRELTNADEYRQRFDQNNRYRSMRNLPQRPVDNHLLAALEHGIPACSGVALGVDRLIMLALKAESLSEIIAFPIDRC